MASSLVSLMSLGLSPEHVYKHAVQYCTKYTPDLSYQDKCTVVALHKQATSQKPVSHPDESNSLLFSVDEEDWLREWNKIKEMNCVEAMREFSAILSSKSDKFSLWMSDLYAGSKATREQLLYKDSVNKPISINFNTYKRPSHIQILQSPAAAYKSNKTIEDVVKTARDTPISNLLPDISHIAKENSREIEVPGVQPGYLWCKRSEAAEFIRSIRELPDSRVLISPGESITIKAPVYPDVNTLFWEFATERYDIGFGAELEVCTDTDTSSPSDQTEFTEIIPKERRLCCEDVIVGCHRAISPSELKGQRTYYLRFDNKYSLLTSKVLYYKVYCNNSVLDSNMNRL
ncbi:hypothetical protein LOD99_11832 [Oopsacas minuta]|uniref:GOLD domain-containing protein n=1 Tax=Oopsacas minuta TaxID=111878 RepID=A0AAV7JKZ3_9METZ|nr:hypothetical protein LOD99_11832 [Oopsacas minuta]